MLEVKEGLSQLPVEKGNPFISCPDQVILSAHQRGERQPGPSRGSLQQSRFNSLRMAAPMPFFHVSFKFFPQGEAAVYQPVNRTAFSLRIKLARAPAFPVSKGLQRTGQTTSLAEQSPLVLWTHGLISRQLQGKSS